MPCRAIMHAQRSAEVTVTARNTGHSTFNCPKTVPARAATSPVYEVPVRDSYDGFFSTHSGTLISVIEIALRCMDHGLSAQAQKDVSMPSIMTILTAATCAADYRKT
eukprot:327310-Pleurochrysis_carterae.AAC.6